MQTLSTGQMTDEISRLTKELLEKMPSDFWDNN
jgi:hypothetical protein